MQRRQWSQWVIIETQKDKKGRTDCKHVGHGGEVRLWALGWGSGPGLQKIHRAIWIYKILPVVPHKAVAEVSKIGNL